MEVDALIAALQKKSYFKPKGKGGKGNFTPQGGRGKGKNYFTYKGGKGKGKGKGKSTSKGSGKGKGGKGKNLGSTFVILKLDCPNFARHSKEYQRTCI